MLKRAALLLLACASLAFGEIPARPYPAVSYKHLEKSDPPQQIYVATIDLSRPGVEVKVSRGGADPDGPGEWQTTLMPPTQIADREHFAVVINGDFFAHYKGKDAEGAAAQQEFKASTMAKVSGPAESDGDLWAIATTPRPMLVIDAHGRPSILVGKTPPEGSRQAIAGSHLLIQDGKIVAPPDETSKFVKGPHPRTAVGIADAGKTLLLVAIDGRSSDAKGMSLRQTAQVLKDLGATDALNLDGGGSTMLGIRDPQTGNMDILNHPSDGKERAVADVLGVKLTKRGPATRPAR